MLWVEEVHHGDDLVSHRRFEIFKSAGAALQKGRLPKNCLFHILQQPAVVDCDAASFGDETVDCGSASAVVSKSLAWLIQLNCLGFIYKTITGC